MMISDFYDVGKNNSYAQSVSFIVYFDSENLPV